MPELRFQIQYTSGDLQKAYEAHLLSYHPVRTRLLLIMGILCVISSISLIVMDQINNNGQGIFLGMSFFVYGIVMILYYRWKISRMGKNIFKQMDEFHTPLVFNISQDKVHTTTASGAFADRNWSSFVKALITKDIVLLYPNQINFLFFPSVYFTSSEFETLKILVRSKVVNILEK